MSETPLHIQQAEGLERIAAMLREHPELAEHFEMLSFSRHYFGDDAKALALFARIAKRYADDHKVDKDYSDKYAKVEARFGGVQIELQAYREEVCERRLVGTEVRKVREYVEIEKEVPVYEWDCNPLLASTRDGES